MQADGAVEFEQVEADPATGGKARKAPSAGDEPEGFPRCPGKENRLTAPRRLSSFSIAQGRGDE